MNQHANQSRYLFHLIIVLSLILIHPVSVLAASLSTQGAPKILYNDIDSGPNTGGENNNGAYLSIFGKNFGSDLTKIKVYVGGGEVKRYMYLGTSLGRPDIQQLSVQLGPATTTGPINVVVNGIPSNTDKTFTIRPGNFYFVSLTGNDSNGAVNDITKPFRTPNYVARSIPSFSPGDFIIVRGGVYNLDDSANGVYSSTWVRPISSGTPGNPMVLMGYPGEKVETTQTTSVEKLFSSYVTISWWVVSNITNSISHCLTGPAIILLGDPASSNKVCYGTSSPQVEAAFNVKIVNIEITGHDVGGMCSGWGDNLVNVGLSTDCKLLGISIHNTSPALAGTEGSHIVYLAATQSRTEVGWNALYNIPASRATIQVHQDSFGGLCWGWKALTDIKIHDNLIHDVAGQAVLMDGGTGDIQFYDNLIYNTPLPNDHRYNDIIALRGAGGMLNAMVYNNTVYANPHYTNKGWFLGFGDAGNFPKHVTLYNNIFQTTDSQDSYYGTENGVTDLQNFIAGGNVTSNNNIWFGSNDPVPSFGGANDVIKDPQFLNPAMGNFHLQPASPAIKNGTTTVSSPVNIDFDGNSRLIGAGFDIGAYLFQSNSNYTIPNPPYNLTVN